MAEDETFESQDSGASDSYPIEAGQIRKGGYIMIKVRSAIVTGRSTRACRVKPRPRAGSAP